MKFKNIKHFLVFLLIDFIFVFCLFNFVKFMFKKVQDYFLNLQNFNLDLQGLEETFLENASNLNLDLLGGNLEIVNQIMQKVMYYSVYTLIGIFLLYCLFQAVQWNLVCNKLKFKKFGKYLLSFILINIPIAFILVYIFYGISYNLRGVVFSSWVSNTYLEEQMSFGGSLPLLIILIVLFLLVEYIGVNIYVFMNKYKLKEAILKSFNNLKNYKLELRFFIYTVILFLGLCTMIINLIFGLVLFLCLIQIFRMSLSKLIK